MKELKYKTEIERLKCNLSDFSELQYVKAFRWVFEDCDEKSFIPMAINNPNKYKNVCQGWALSFFDNQENAKNRLLEIVNHRKLIFKKLVTHIAEGNILENDGVANSPNNYGHFDLFEYKDINLSNKFEIIETIFDGNN